jgi:hypothetical protein
LEFLYKTSYCKGGSAMAYEAKHAFGNSENLSKALETGAIDAHDILLLDGDTEPKIGWVNEKGEVRIVKNSSVDTEEVEEVIELKLANAAISNEDIEGLFD